MMICDVIRSVKSERAIFFLLDAYLETTQFGSVLPDYVTKLPVNGHADVEARLSRLTAEFMMNCNRPSARSDEKARRIMGESLQIFAAAFDRLNLLRSEPWSSLKPDSPDNAFITPQRNAVGAVRAAGCPS